MIKYILIGIVILIGGFCLVAAMQPADFRYSRSTTILAPPAVVFDYLNNFQKWNDWSPWAKLDPAAKNTFEGPPAGVGAGFGWSGNNQIGEGKMTITDSKPNELVAMRLEFIRPFAAVSTAQFDLKPDGDKTQLTWSMYGKNNFMAKAMGLVMNCEKMVGDDFERGFANLKAIVEKPAGS